MTAIPGWVPSSKPVRGPQPAAVPDRPDVPRQEWIRTDRHTSTRRVRDLGPHLHAGTYVRAHLARMRDLQQGGTR